MQHILDNPIWNALTTGNQKLASGSENVKYIQRDVGLFAGFKNNSPEALIELYELLAPKSQVILFTEAEIIIPGGWNIKLKRPLLQMVLQEASNLASDNIGIVPLADEHVTKMQELTKLTNPGPFFSKTILLGNYEGIFIRGKLVAMTGQRLKAGTYTEVSAVCTHPDHKGKGYAAKLLVNQIGKIKAASQIPFLHVYPENIEACNLYKKLGFETRKKMLVYFIEKEG